MVSQAANLVLDFSLMVAMSNFERGLRFANVLALTLLACGQIYEKEELQFNWCLIGYLLPVLVLSKYCPSFKIGQETLQRPHFELPGVSH